MIITLLALTSALSLLLSVFLYKRLNDISARVALNKASITARNPLSGYDLDNLALLLELSPLLCDARTESALRELINLRERGEDLETLTNDLACAQADIEALTNKLTCAQADIEALRVIKHDSLSNEQLRQLDEYLKESAEISDFVTSIIDGHTDHLLGEDEVNANIEEAIDNLKEALRYALL